jgi:hypothetical protein
VGGCDRRSKNCQADVKDKMHDPKRLNKGLLPEEVAAWPARGRRRGQPDQSGGLAWLTVSPTAPPPSRAPFRCGDTRCHQPRRVWR